MLVDIAKLALVPIDFAFEKVSLSIPRDGGDIEAIVSVKGEVAKDNNIYKVKGNISAELSLKCDLCLKAFEQHLDLDFEEIYSDTQDEDGEYILLSGLDNKIVDLKPAVIGNIILNLPMRIVCSQDCKGLCPKCGHDLNEGDCGCERGYINPQFEQLLGLKF